MKKIDILTEAIELEEPVEELPPIEAETPIIKETPAEEPSIEIKENAIAGMIGSEVSNAYNSIDSLRSVIATIAAEVPNREDILTILNDVIDSTTIQIGMLQKAIDLIDGKSNDLLDDGNDAADNALQDSNIAGEDAIKEESKDENQDNQ